MDPHTSTYILSRSTLAEILHDLCVRFILNLPEEELNSIERLSFQIEAAQWYFEDFIREINPQLPSLNLRSFLSKIFAVLPLPLIAGLPPDGAENAFFHFMAYKTRVPVRGAIMLNPTMDKCLLVKGWKKGASWSFPRGKINKDEDDMVCAVREVLEETGFDCNGMAREEDFVEVVMREQNLRLYIIPGVPEDTAFECQTRKEISDIKWHKLSELPTFSKKKSQQNQPQNDVRTGKYYMVVPFIKDLRKWISTKGKKWLQDQHQQQLATAANLIADETEVEEEITILSPMDASARLRKLANIPPPMVSNGYSSTTENDEASQRLKNMVLLGAPKDQEDQSARLMSILGAGAGNSEQSSAPLNVAQLAPNPRALLSMLQNSSGAAPQVPEVNRALPNPQNPSHALASAQSFNIPKPHLPQQQTLEYLNNQPSHPAERPQYSAQQQPKKQPAPLKNMGGIGAGTGWPQFPRNIPEPSNHPPSPPPTSSFAPPQHVPLPLKLGQYSQTPQSQNEFSPPRHQQQPPPTPLDVFIPPPIPSKPPDPNQAGTLLSILKGATPVPQQAATHAPPIAPTTPTPTRVKPSTHTSVPQNPPIPKGPKAQKQQQSQLGKNALLATLRGSANGSPRASTVAPGSQAFAPPPQPAFNPPSRPSTVGPQSRGSPAAGSSSQYGPPKAQVLPASGPSFDRRESVSNQQQQALLAMFRTGSAAGLTSGTAPTEEAVVSSPEQSPAKPRVRSTSTGRGQGQRKEKEVQKSPLGREREGLMAYLEGVAKMGGQ